MNELSESGFIALSKITYEWTDISVLQERKSNVLYYAQRYGKRYVLKGLHADCQSKTDFRLLQEKEFALGIALNHPHIAETYSLEEVAGCGRCIVMEYVDGTTLSEWLASKPSQTERERVMMQQIYRLLDMETEKLQHIADNAISYIAYNQQLLNFWEYHAQVRDSLANCYADDADLKYRCVDIWTQEFGKRKMDLDKQVKSSKPLQ